MVNISVPLPYVLDIFAFKRVKRKYKCVASIKIPAVAWKINAKYNTKIVSNNYVELKMPGGHFAKNKIKEVQTRI